MAIRRIPELIEKTKHDMLCTTYMLLDNIRNAMRLFFCLFRLYHLSLRILCNWCWVFFFYSAGNHRCFGRRLYLRCACPLNEISNEMMIQLATCDTHNRLIRLGSQSNVGDLRLSNRNSTDRTVTAHLVLILSKFP